MIQLAEGKITGRIHAVGGPAYPGYVVRGERKNLMIEAGLNLLAPLYARSLGEILGHGNALDYLFVTHSHYDHLGAVPYLKRIMPGLTVGAHERVKPILEKESVLATMNRLSESLRPLFGEVAGSEDVAIRPFDFGLTLREGDETDLGGLICRVYETPGHTRDSLAFFLPGEGILFTGEAAGVPEGAGDGDLQVCFLTSYDDYLASLEKLASLGPRTICLGHGWIYTGDDAADFLGRSLEATPRYRRLIERYLHEAGGDVEQAVAAMARKEYDEKGTIHQERNAYLTNLNAQVRHIASLDGRGA